MRWQGCSGRGPAATEAKQRSSLLFDSSKQTRPAMEEVHATGGNRANLRSHRLAHEVI